MQKLDPKTHGRSPDLVAENVAQLKELFPDAFTEGKIDFDALRQLLGDYTDDQVERYGLNWTGKSRSRQIAQTPSSGTLRPAPDESVAWDTTQNIFIEGDNLEVLKLLQKSYHRKVKMIYIDPPYNTGKEFIYPDRYQDNLDTYLRYTGQVDGEGLKITANAETQGRYHTNWLNMMYPRLKLARNLLRDDGVIFVSIDDHEVHNLRHLMDELFGSENFIGCFVWKSRQNRDNRTLTGASSDHEYVMCFGNRIRGATRNASQYSNPDNDPRGPWASANMVGIATADRRPNLHYDLIDPRTNINYGCPPMGWRYDRSTMSRLTSEGLILWPSSPEGRPRRKKFLAELSTDFTGYSSIVGSEVYTRDGTADIEAIFGARVFDFPKPVNLVSELIEQGSTECGDIVLDFFAGSGTTGEAVWRQSKSDGIRRRFILVQLPEHLDPSKLEQRTAYGYCLSAQLSPSMAALGQERIRRAAKNIDEESRQTIPGIDNIDAIDLGFRVFKLDSTNIKPWDGDFDTLEPNLLAAVENIKRDRSEDDVLYELLLKYGLDLSLPIEERVIEGKRVFILGAGALVVCLASGVTLGVVEQIGALKAELQPAVMRVVFRDASFKDDVVKTNAVQILTRAGIDDIKSL